MNFKKELKKIFKWIFAIIAVFLLKTIKNYFKKGNNRFKKLLSTNGFHPSIVNNPFIIFNSYSSKSGLYLNFWASFVLKVFLFSINRYIWKSEKIAQLLNLVGLKHAFFYDINLLLDKTTHKPYSKINVPNIIPINEKIVVYSVMIGDYDEILDPIYVSDNCDYILFTNNVNIKTKIWKVHLIKLNNDFSNKWNVLYYKTLAHKILPFHYNYSIYIDAKILICGDIKQLINFLNYNCCLAFLKHSTRCSLKEEIEICIKWKIVTKEEVSSQYVNYLENGFPDNLGLIDSCILVRKHKDIEVQKIMETWFEEFTKYPTRDQFSVMYSIWKSKMKNYCIIDGNVWSNQFMIIKKHKQ